MKKPKAALIVFILLSVFFVLAYFLFGIKPWASFVSQTPLQTDVSDAIVLNVTENKRQTPFDCGAFNIATLMEALGQEIDMRNIVDMNRSSMIPRLGVVPEVIVSTLKKNNVDSSLKTFRWMTDIEKTETLKTLLVEDKPMILLVKRHGYLHFVLVTGFNGDEVFLYDPLMAKGKPGLTIDKNDEVTGNNTLAFSELIELWDEASVLGFYKNLAVIVEKP